VARLGTLKSWTLLVTVMLSSCDFGDTTQKTSFILQTLQLILPKLERYSTENPIEAVELARLAKSLLTNLSFGSSSSLGKGRAGDVANDRLFQLFRVCLRGIHSPISGEDIREIFYNICYRYLIGVSTDGKEKASPALKRHSTQTIKASGERVIDVICDDAYAGDGTCRVSALLLLDALVSLAQQEDNKYVLEALARINFVGSAVDALKNIPSELATADPQGMARIPHRRFPNTSHLTVSPQNSLLCYPLISRPSLSSSVSHEPDRARL
jgi:nuclear pore complex protein Nup205